MEREASWYDENSDLAALPLLASPWLGLYVLLTHWIESVAEKDYARGVVDVGSGPGRLGELLEARGYPHPYIGFDFSPRAVELAQRAAMVEVWLTDLRLPQVREGLWEYPGVIVFSEVLEHLGDDLSIIESVPQDRFVIITGPSFDSAAHVRHYSSLAELRDRYARFLQLHLTGAVDLSPPQGRRIYAICGFRM